MRKPNVPSGAILLQAVLALAAAGQAPLPPPVRLPLPSVTRSDYNWNDVRRLRPGTEVRVVHRVVSHPPLGRVVSTNKAVSGILQSVTDTTLQINAKSGPQSFDKAQIYSVSVRRQGKALIAVGVGLAAGAVTVLKVCLPSTPGSGSQTGCNKKGALALGMGLGAVAGTGAGLAWRWRRIW